MTTDSTSFFGGLDRFQSFEELRSRYRELVRQFHPDAPDGGNAAVFKQIVAEYAEARKKLKERPCPTCDGSGKRMAVGGFAPMSLGPCRTCKGTGHDPRCSDET